MGRYALGRAAIATDGVEPLIQNDETNRVASLRRGPQSNPLMTATYTYFDDDRIERVEYGDGSSVNYTYDAARRLTVIDHRDATNATFLELTYAYSDDDLPISITESDGVGVVAVVEFEYDARHRLIGESRSGATPYELAYTYDQGGNRLSKLDSMNDELVVYHYDLEDPVGFASKNNRLRYYETFDVAGASSTLVSTTWYFYNPAGNPTRIVTQASRGLQSARTFSDIDASPVLVTPPTYSATRFEYAKNGQAVTFVLGETWEPDGGDPDSCPENYDIAFAREFRYDSGRARYLNRELDVSEESGLMHNPPIYAAVPDGDTWTDYDGDELYGDWTVSGSSASDDRSFALGVATVDPFTASGPTNTKYFHADMIGTTRSMSAGGTATQGAVYTAFGERIDGTNHRYGYAGSWGYQSHDGVPYLHVGARYYDQTSGRFLQRDPLGLWGGRNAYSYVDLQPTLYADPEGEEKTKTPHGWRDSKTGRFTKPPWWRRAGRWGFKRIPVYACASGAAAVAHRIMGKPYEDPIDVALDTAENLGRAWWNDRSWRQKAKEIQRFPKHFQDSADRKTPWA